MNARNTFDVPPTRPARGPFYRPFNVHDVKDGRLAISVEATADELPAIAKAVGLPSVQRLAVRYRIAAHAGGRYDVRGDLDANVTQICVVTLDAFDSDVSNEIDLTFAQPMFVPDIPAARQRDRDAPRGRGRLVPVAPAPVPGNDDQEDPADPIVDDTIDLGTLALEFLTLACDLYPRKPGIAFTDVIVGEGEAAEAEPSAFAALERLKDRS